MTSGQRAKSARSRMTVGRFASATTATGLVAPGASLGGARPKANFTEVDGSLWIGKFPARDDDRDVGAWEYVLHGLAKKAGIDVPPAKLVRLNKDFHTFCVQRFDRLKTARRFYASTHLP